jgi:hypothetical protein
MILHLKRNVWHECIFQPQLVLCPKFRNSCSFNDFTLNFFWHGVYFNLSFLFVPNTQYFNFPINLLNLAGSCSD